MEGILVCLRLLLCCHVGHRALLHRDHLTIRQIGISLQPRRRPGNRGETASSAGGNSIFGRSRGALAQGTLTGAERADWFSALS